MDVVRLDPATYKPDSLVEGYSSMIWTERYLENGEFQMTTAKIEEMRNLIPEGSLISLRDTDEVMFVETHSVDYDDNGIAVLTISGRTYETFLENRAAEGTYQETWTSLKTHRPSRAAGLIMWNYLVNNTGQDPTRTAKAKSLLDVVPNVVVSESVSRSEVSQFWSFQPGPVYQPLRDFLALGSLGVRSIRPSDSTATLLSYDTSLTASRELTIETVTSHIPQLRLDVYDGLDRSRYQTVRDAVIFHYNSGHISSPKYLFSIKDWMTMAVVTSSIGTTYIWPGSGVTPPAVDPSGLDRRVLYLDAGDQGDAFLADFQNAILQKGLVELTNHNRKILFDGAISPISPYKYKEQYFLGDTVTLMAQYGYEASMMVAEYVRTEDQEGDRGYPTLILPS